MHLWIVVLDDAPLRKKAGAKYTRLMAKIEEARRELEAFEKEEKGEFARWIATTFGPMLSELRDNQAKIDEKQHLVRMVEDEMFFNGGSYRSAYAKVMQQLSEPEPPPADAFPPNAEEFTDPFADDDKEGSDGEDEDEEAFRAFVLDFTGEDVDDLSDEDYESLFWQFKNDIKKFLPPSSKPAEVASKKSIKNRLKELYRVLVRRLHPDSRDKGATHDIALWHEVQKAYQQGDVDRLEVLLARTDLAVAGSEKETSLGQLQLVLKSLERDLQALKRTLSAAKKDPAWNFSNRTDRSTMEKGIRREMKEELTYQRRYLEDMERQIASWANVPAKKKKEPVVSAPPLEKKPSSRGYGSGRQDEFNFW